MRGFCCCLLTFFLGVGLVSVPSCAQSVNVTTWHNDNGRTGQNTSETTLTTGINQRFVNGRASGGIGRRPIFARLVREVGV